MGWLARTRRLRHRLACRGVPKPRSWPRRSSGAQDQGLERVHRGGARRVRLGPGRQQDPQRLLAAIGAWLCQPFGRQGIARRAGRVSGVRLTARPPAGALRAASLGDRLAVRVQVAGQPQLV
jgi:hypothetical protein